LSGRATPGRNLARKELAPRLRRSRVVPFTSFHALGISITNGRYASNFKKLKL